MSRPSKPKPATPADAPPPSHPHPAPPQVTPDTTGAEAALAATVAAPVDLMPDAPPPDHAYPEPKGPDGYGVKVQGPAKGRWRIGRHFGPEAVVIPLNELTEAQMKALQADPELNCVGVDLEA